MEVSFQIHAPAALLPEEQHAEPSGLRSGSEDSGEERNCSPFQELKSCCPALNFKRYINTLATAHKFGTTCGWIVSIFSITFYYKRVLPTLLVILKVTRPVMFSCDW